MPHGRYERNHIGIRIGKPHNLNRLYKWHACGFHEQQVRVAFGRVTLKDDSERPNEALDDDEGSEAVEAGGQPCGSERQRR